MQKYIVFLGVQILLLSSAAVFAVAADTTGGSQPQSYASTQALATGTIVQIADSTGRKVRPATLAELDKAFGVVVSTNSLPLSISDTTVENQVFVATNGRRAAIVTTEEGPIKAGDLVAVSSLNGTLTKATPEHPIVFGRALADFSGTSNILGTATLRDVANTPKQTVAIGSIPVTIDIVKNPQIKSTTTNLPSLLQRVGQAVAERPVSGARLYIGAIVAALSAAFALVILYVGIRSAIISIGRNPLAKKSVIRALLEVIVAGILVLLIGLFTVYLILRL